MAIELVGQAQGSFDVTGPTVSLTSLTGGLAASPSADDIVVVHTSVGGSLTNNTPTTSGYTIIEEMSESPGTSSNDTAVAAYYKIMDDSPDTSIDLPGSGSSNVEVVYFVQVWRGVDITTPMDVTPTTNTTTTNVIVGASITAATNGALAVSFGGYGSADGSNHPYPSPFFSDNVMTLARNGGSRLTGAGLGTMTLNASDTWTSPIFDKYWSSGNAAISYALRPNNATKQRGIKVVGFTEDISTGSTSGTTVSLESLTGGIATAPQEGDMVLVSQAENSLYGTIGDYDVTGYTKIGEVNGNDSSDCSQILWYKIMGSTPDTDIEVFAPNVQKRIKVYVFRGLDITTPLDVTTTFANGANTNDINSASITPTTAGTMVLTMGVCNVSVQGTVTVPTGYTHDSTFHDSSFNIMEVYAQKEWSGSGAEDPSAWGFSSDGSSFSWGAFTLALRPATPVEIAPSKIDYTLSAIAPTTKIYYLINAVRGVINLGFKLPGTFIQKMFNEDKDSTTITNESK